MQVSIAHENEDYFLETETLKLLLKVILVTGCKWNCFLFSFFPAAKNQKLKVRTWLVGNAVNICYSILAAAELYGFFPSLILNRNSYLVSLLEIDKFGRLFQVKCFIKI